MTKTSISKTQFLNNLEVALKQLILNRLFDDASPEKKRQLSKDVEAFIRENVSEYSREELLETFVSAEAAIALFLEYQSAQALADDRLHPPETLTPITPGRNACNSCPPVAKKTIYPDRSWVEPVSGIDFIWVSGGAFQMGSGDWDDEGQADEKPVHTVNLDGFWIGKYPVTVAQYTIFMGVCSANRPAWMETDGTLGSHSSKKIPSTVPWVTPSVIQTAPLPASPGMTVANLPRGFQTKPVLNSSCPLRPNGNTPHAAAAVKKSTLAAKRPIPLHGMRTTAETPFTQ